MKPAQKKEEAQSLYDIFDTLKRVPKAQLRLVRDIVHALAKEKIKKPKTVKNNGKKKSLLDTPFCGMWVDRDDIITGKAFAPVLRQQLESRGDRRKDLR